MNYLDFQYNIPVFVRNFHKEIIWKNHKWTYNQHIPWQELGIPVDVVRTWFAIDLVYHNPELEKQTKVGDRLQELDKNQLDALVNGLNAVVKSKTVGTQEFNAKKCKKSTIEEKQRGLLRSFLRNNNWIDEEFHKIRDSILGD